jgi:hypothetical protein
MTDTKPTPTPADVAQVTNPTGTINPEPTRLPEDHPLVTALARQKQENEALKAKAARLDEIESAQKTDAERVAEQIAEAKAEVEKIPTVVTEHLRDHLVALHKISAEDAELFLTATSPDILLKQVSRLMEGKGRVGVIPTQGTANPSGTRVSSYELGRERGLARYQKQ